jgi:WD40 repeat protein
MARDHPPTAGARPMPRRFLTGIVIFGLCGLLTLARGSGAVEVDRSPIDLVLAPDETWLASANSTAGTVSLVSLPGGKVLHELPVGAQPVALALAEQGKTLLVSCHSGGDLVLLGVLDGRLSEKGRIAVGMQPYGIAVSPGGDRAYVAQTAAAKVVEVDLVAKKVLRTMEVGRWPRHLALSPDGKRLAVGASGDRGVTLVDVEAGQQLSHDAFVGLNIGQLVTSKDGQYAYFPWMVYRGFPPTAGNIRLGWVLASRIARVRFDGATRREAMSLDPPGKAIADPYGFALTSDDSRIVCSASGTHELLVYRATDLPLKEIGSDDHGPREVLRDSDPFLSHSARRAADGIANRQR